MSKKDWKLLAAILREHSASYALIRAIADGFLGTNDRGERLYPRFDPMAFIRMAYNGDLELIEARAAG